MTLVPARYTATAIALHWAIALLIVTNLGLIWTLDWWPDSAARGVIDTHKSIGITVLGLAILRLLWRATHPPPPLPPGYKLWERRAAHAAHWALYLIVFCLPLSGWMHDSAWKDAASHPMLLYGLMPWPRIAFIVNLDPATKEYLHGLFGQIHASFAYLLYGLLALHILGALKHQWLEREPELQRMWPGRRARGRGAMETERP